MSALPLRWPHHPGVDLVGAPAPREIRIPAAQAERFAQVLGSLMRDLGDQPRTELLREIRDVLRGGEIPA